MGATCCSACKTPEQPVSANQPGSPNEESKVFHYFMPMQTVASHVRHMSVHPAKATGKVPRFHTGELRSPMSTPQAQTDRSPNFGGPRSMMQMTEGREWVLAITEGPQRRSQPLVVTPEGVGEARNCPQSARDSPCIKFNTFTMKRTNAAPATKR